MATLQYRMQEYDHLLWEKVKEKCGRVTKVLASESTLSPQQAARFMKKDSLLNARKSTRNLLSVYLGHKDFNAFCTAMDKDPATALAVREEKPVNDTFTHSKLHINMPARPELFLGRLPLLQEIHSRLTDREQRDNVLLLTSMGGMGKTTLLYEYLNRDTCRKHFRWIVALSVNRNLESVFVQAMADALQVDISAVFAKEKRLELVIQAMQQEAGDNLVAIDNINEADYPELLSMYRHFRRTGWKILITTRTNPDGMECIEVKELDLNDAVLLFLNYYVPDTIGGDTKAVLRYMKEQQFQPDLEELLTHIACHTLFTELLAKTGRKTRATPQLLLKHLRDEDLRHPELERLVNTGAHPYHTSSSLNTATLHHYMLSLFDTDYLLEETTDESMAAENRQRVAMLQFFSLLPAEEIPIEHLKALWRVDKEQANEFEDRLDILKQTGWIKGEHSANNGLTYKMHHLIQEVVFEKLQPTMKNCAPLVKSLTEIMQKRRSLSAHELAAYKKYMQSARRKLPDLSLTIK